MAEIEINSKEDVIAVILLILIFVFFGVTLGYAFFDVQNLQTDLQVLQNFVCKEREYGVSLVFDKLENGVVYCKFNNTVQDSYNGLRIQIKQKGD